MSKNPTYTFVFLMWVLIILGGGIAVAILGPISISGYGEFDMILSSILKATLALIMVVAWIFILSKIKNWIFQKQLQS